jgi:Cu/Ag efflux pump CusA
MIVRLKSTDGQYDEVALSDYLARNVVEELRRIEGVGRVQLFGAERAMRIWVDPARLLSYKLSMGDLSDADHPSERADRTGPRRRRSHRRRTAGDRSSHGSGAIADPRASSPPSC